MEDLKEMSTPGVSKEELKAAQDRAWQDALKGMSAKDRKKAKDNKLTYKKKRKKEKTKKKLKERDPPFAALRKEVTDAYAGKTKYPPFINEKEMRKFIKGKGKGESEAIEEHFGPGSMERLIQGKKSKVPIGMRGGGRVGRGMGKALRGGGAVTRS